MTYYGVNPGVPLSLGDHVPHLKHDRPKPKPAGRPSEVVARCGDHALVHTKRDSWFDTAPVHGWTYLGRNLDEAEARKRWRDKLKREGAM